MGHAGLLPDEFYSFEMDDFWCFWKGFNEKLVYEQALLRRHAYIVHCSMVQKPAALKKLWPLPGDDVKAKVSDNVLKQLKQLREQDALKKHKEKNG